MKWGNGQQVSAEADRPATPGDADGGWFSVDARGISAAHKEAQRPAT
ncbi:MAG: hypothetical protein AB7O38_20355 [Pirellulaceae bacterium]